jgi:Fe2+ or Zn2+ uptake regulation protein
MDVKTARTDSLPPRYRLTKQRAAVLRALEKGSHRSAESILERVRGEMPGVSLGTIYRTLDILRKSGLVQMFSSGGSAARYEAAADKHHHLLCSICRELTDVRGDVVGALALAIAADAGYSDIDVALTITGRCSDCSARR